MLVMAHRHFAGLIGIGVAVAACVLLVDRPLALWLNARFFGTRTFAISESIFRPLDAVLIVGAVLLVVLVLSSRFYDPPAWVSRLVRGGAGAAVALLAAEVLKLAIGRSQVFPPFLHDHVYALRPFAGSKDFMAFPSATMAGVSGLISGYGVHRRSGRTAAALVLLVLGAAILVAAGHWLSDIIGGTYLGLVSGAAVARSLHDGRRSDVDTQRLE